MRTLALLVSLLPSLALPCSVAVGPNNEQPFPSTGNPPALGNAVTDTTAPGTPSVTEVKVTLIQNGCNGRGSACVQLDELTMELTATDDHTAPENMRYAATLGATALEVLAATRPTLLFSPDFGSATHVRATLGFGGQRDGEGFKRQALCFALSAVDEAGNVGPASTVKCLDTTSANAPETTVIAGTPCTEAGCSSTPMLGLSGLAVWWARRRRVR